MTYSLSIEIREDLNLAVWRVTGNVPMAVMMARTRIYVREGSYRPGMNLLSINKNITSSYTGQELDDLMSVISSAYGPLGHDILCASVLMDDLQFGLGRMFQVTAARSVLTFKPFRTVAGAREWLDIADEIVISEDQPDHGAICAEDAFHGTG